MDIAVNNVGTVHAPFSQLCDVTGIGESRKMTIQDGGFIASARVQG